MMYTSPLSFTGSTGGRAREGQHKDRGRQPPRIHGQEVPVHFKAPYKVKYVYIQILLITIICPGVEALGLNRFEWCTKAVRSRKGSVVVGFWTFLG